MKKMIKKLFAVVLGAASAICVALGAASMAKETTNIYTADAATEAELTWTAVTDGMSSVYDATTGCTTHTNTKYGWGWGHYATTKTTVPLDGLTLTIGSTHQAKARFGVVLTPTAPSSYPFGEKDSQGNVTKEEPTDDMKIYVQYNAWNANQVRLMVDDDHDYSNTVSDGFGGQTIPFLSSDGAAGKGLSYLYSNTGSPCEAFVSDISSEYSYTVSFSYQGAHSSGNYNYWRITVKQNVGSSISVNPSVSYVMDGQLPIFNGADSKVYLSTWAFDDGGGNSNFSFYTKVGEMPKIDILLSNYQISKERTAFCVEERQALVDAIESLTDETQKAEYLNQLAAIDAKENRWIARGGAVAPSFKTATGHTVLRPNGWGQGYTYNQALPLDGLTVILGSENHMRQSRFGFGLSKVMGDYAPEKQTVCFTMIPYYAEFVFDELDTGKYQDALFVCDSHDERENGVEGTTTTILYTDEACTQKGMWEEADHFVSVADSDTTYSISFKKCANGNYGVTITLLEGTAYGELKTLTAYLPKSQLTDVLDEEGKCFITAFGVELLGGYPFYVDVHTGDYATTYANAYAAADSYELAIRKGESVDTLNSLQAELETANKGLNVYNAVEAQVKETALATLREEMSGIQQSASLVVNEGLTLNYKLSIPDSVLAELKTIQMNVGIYDQSFSFDVSNFSYVDGKWICPIPMFGPQWMTANISLDFLAQSANGEMLFQRSVPNYSIKAYCESVLADGASSSLLKTAITDLLNYGAEAQLYTGRLTDNLANAGIDQQYATVADTSEAVNCLALEQGANVKFTTMTMLLEDKVTAYAKFTYSGSSSNLKATIQVGNTTKSITVEEIGNGTYYLQSAPLSPMQFDEQITFSVYVGSTREARCRLSVNSYIQRNADHEKSGNLVKVLYKYGVGIKSYAVMLPANKLIDADFRNGFSIYDPTVNTNILNNYYRPLGNTTKPSWSLYQWSSKYDLSMGTQSSANSVYTIADTAKSLSWDSNTNAITLELNASKEYGTTDRIDGQAWPHLLLQQNYSGASLVRLADQSSLRMKMDYTVTKCEDKMNGTVNENLHCVQFVWYVTLQNRNANSADKNQYMWFGIMLFDNRKVGVSVGAYNAADTGKVDATDQMIYQPATQDWAPNGVSPAVGDNVSVDFNILPVAKAAFEQVKAQGKVFQNTTWEDLYIGSTNFGFEAQGTYDIAVTINQVGLIASRNETVLESQTTTS